MENKRIENDFRDGLAQDGVPTFQPNSVIQDSLNGRIIYNENGTYSWQNAKGTKPTFTLPIGYVPLVAEEVFNYLIIISTDNTNSEIGFVTEDSFGVFAYQQAFNDANDPYGDLMNLSTRHQIKASVFFENEDKINIYWDDDYNEPRTFNIMAGKPFGWTPAYPNWYSVHSMATMMDFSPDMVYYNKTIEGTGSLPTARYQVCYRLIHQNGYATPYSCPSQLITVTSDFVDGINWTNYQMTVSDTLASKSIEVQIDNIDTRFDRIQIVMIAWVTPTSPGTARLVLDTAVTSAQQVFTIGNYSVNDLLVPIEEITQLFQDVTRAKTNDIFRGHLHRANLHLRERFAIDASNVEVYPVLRNMLSDTKGASGDLPFTHQNPTANDVISTIQYEKFGGALATKSNPIVNEYINYKGTQIEHTLKGEFRGETVPFGIVLWDIKGQPMFVAHIADVSFPNQFGAEGSGTTLTALAKLSGTTFTDKYYDLSQDIIAGNLTQLTDGQDTFKPTGQDTGGAYVTDTKTTDSGEVPLKILGKLFNNIDLTDYIYDTDGKIQVSGFSIVRMPRFENIQFQGALIPIINNGDEVEDYFDLANGGDPNVDYRAVIHSPDLYFNEGNGMNIKGNNENIQILSCAYGQFDLVAYDSDADYAKDYLTSRIDSSIAGANNFYGSTGFASQTYWTIGSGQLISKPPLKTDVVLGTSVYNLLNNTLISQNSLVLGMSLQNATIFQKSGDTHPSTRVVNYQLGVSAPIINTTELDGRIYHNIGHFQPINASVIADVIDGSGNIIFNGVEVWGGDCYLDFFGFCRLLPYIQGDVDNNARGMFLPIESKYNFQMQEGNEFAKVGTTHIIPVADAQFTNGYYINDTTAVIEPFDINDVCLALDNWRDFFPLKSTAQLQNDLPITLVYSELKILGEELDSFRKFLVNSFGNFNGVNGEVNVLFNQFSDLYCLQTNGFSRVRFNDRALVATQLGQLTTGTGLGFEGYDYIDTEIGTQHQWSFCQSDKASFWVDAAKGKLMQFAANGLADIGEEFGMHNWIMNRSKDYWLMPPFLLLEEGYAENKDYTTREYANIDNPCKVGGILSCYDFKNSALLVTFTKVVYEMQYIKIEPPPEPFDYVVIDDFKTLEYNDKKNRFQPFKPYKPNLYMQFKRSVLSTTSELHNENIDRKAYMYDEGIRGKMYNNLLPATLKFVVKGDDIVDSKYFDNGRLQVNKEGRPLIASVVATGKEMTPQTIILNDASVDSRPSYLEGILRYPIMAKNQRQRIRDKYVTLEFEIVNDGNDTLVQIPLHETIYRISEKI